MVDYDQQFINAARSYIGVPWVHQGRTRRGLDCIGLVVVSARACGLDVPLLSRYGRTPDYPQLKRELMRFGSREGAIFPGAVVVYKFDSVHIAIATSSTTVVQALTTVGRVAECSINFVPSQFWRFNWPS